MTTTQLIEVAVAALLIGAGIWLQIRGKREDAQHGSQGAVILIIVGLIVAIHGLGLLEYRAPESGL
jgi:predicted transporter